MLSGRADNKIDSWAICWFASVFLKRGLCLHPFKTLVQNIGNDCSGIHGAITNNFLNKELVKEINVNRIPLVTSDAAFKALRTFYDDSKKVSWMKRIIHKLRNF